MTSDSPLALDALIEALLFWRAEPVAIAELAKNLAVSEEQTRTALIFLRGRLAERGVVLLEKDGAVMLGTHPAAAELIERLAKEELNKDLGKASLETLTIVLYKNPITRAEIDYKGGFGHGTCGLVVHGIALKEKIIMAIKGMADYYASRI